MRLASQWRSQWLQQSDRDGSECSQYITVHGRFVEVLRLGVGRGDPLVLIPGLAGGSALIRPLARRLARSQEVVLFDLAGEREPFARLEADRVSDDAADVALLLERLGLERPAVFGVSYGGAVALELAVQRPSLLGALVLYGAEARFHNGLGAKVARRVLERFPLPPDSPFINQFLNLLHGGVPSTPEFAQFVVERCWGTEQAAMVARLRALESFDVTDRLWRIDVPSLILAGSRDVIVPPSRQQALAQSIAGARFAAVEGAAHVGFLTHTPEIRIHVQDLLRDRLRAAL